MSELEFRMTIIEILAGLEKSMEDTRESLSGERKKLNVNKQKTINRYFFIKQGLLTMET